MKASPHVAVAAVVLCANLGWAGESTLGNWQLLKEDDTKEAPGLHAIRTFKHTEGELASFSISCTHRDFRRVRPKFHAEASLVARLAAFDMNLSVNRINTRPLTLDALGQRLVRYNGVTVEGRVRFGDEKTQGWTTQLFEYLEGVIPSVVFIDELTIEKISAAHRHLSRAESDLLSPFSGHLPVFDSLDAANATAKRLAEKAMSVDKIWVRLYYRTSPGQIPKTKKGGIFDFVIPINNAARGHIRKVMHQCGVKLPGEADSG